AAPPPRAPPRPHQRAPPTRRADDQEKEIGDVGGSRSAAPAGRSAQRRGGAARSVGTRSLGRRSSRARHPPRTRESPTKEVNAGREEEHTCEVQSGLEAVSAPRLAPR